MLRISRNKSWETQKGTAILGLIFGTNSTAELSANAPAAVYAEGSFSALTCARGWVDRKVIELGHFKIFKHSSSNPTRDLPSCGAMLDQLHLITSVWNSHDVLPFHVFICVTGLKNASYLVLYTSQQVCVSTSRRASEINSMSLNRCGSRTWLQSGIQFSANLEEGFAFPGS
jgi:hypothetical protein